MRSAAGVIFSAANRWKVSATISKSGSRCLGPVWPARPASQAGSRWAAHETDRRCQRTGFDTPLRLAPEQATGELPYCVGREGRSQVGLYRPPRSVDQSGLGCSDGGGAVGEVVGDHLLGVHDVRAESAQATGRPVDY